MSNFENVQNKVEKASDSEAIEFLKKLGQLRFSYLTNQICLKRQAEDLQNTLFFPYDGKRFVEIVEPFISDAEMRWKKLIGENKLPHNTEEGLQNFSEQGFEFLRQIKAVKRDVVMTEQEKESIQATAKSLIETLDSLIALRPE